MNTKFFADIAERAAKTAVQVFLAQQAASGFGWIDFVQDASVLQKGALAALGAAMSVVTSGLSSWAGNADSASLVDDV